MVTVRHSIKYSPLAKNDLKEIYKFILEDTKSKNQAQKVITGITEEVKAISLFPTKHRIEPKFNDCNIRFAVKWKYKILFEIIGEMIYVYQVFHASQSPAKITDKIEKEG